MLILVLLGFCIFRYFKTFAWGNSFCLFFLFYAFASDFKIPAAVYRFGCHSNEYRILLFSSRLRSFITAFQAVKLHRCRINSLSGTSFFFLGSLTLEDNTTRRARLMSELSIQCSTCHESTPLPTSTSVTQRGKSYDINR